MPQAWCRQGTYERAVGFTPKRQHALGRPAPPPAHNALIRLLLGELTSLSLVKLVVCTQEGRKNEHKGVLFFDVSRTHTQPAPHHPLTPCEHRSGCRSFSFALTSALRFHSRMLPPAMVLRKLPTCV